MNARDRIDAFLSSDAFAVVGASENPAKYGHKCYRCYLEAGRRAYPVNPTATTILGNPVFPDLASLPERVEAISVITPPAVTERVVEDAIQAGVRHVWMQPGAESAAAVRRAEAAGLNVIAGGPCLLVVLGYREA